MSSAAQIKDDDGLVVTAGCTIHFGYGSPGVGVWAKVIDRDGDLVALTTGHKPKECRVADLRKHVGNFWITKTKPQ